jgi:hypothetical protein
MTVIRHRGPKVTLATKVSTQPPARRDANLKRDVAEAVKEAGEKGNISRHDIFRRFEQRGGKATIYRMINMALAEHGIKLAARGASPWLKNEILALENHALELADLPPPLTDTPIDEVAELHADLADANRLKALAKSPDGKKVLNAKLLMFATDVKGRIIERLSRVRVSQDEASQAAVYLKQITAAILEEPPEVKARILARLRGVNSSWGL